MTLFRLFYSILLGCLLLVNLEAQQVVLPMDQLTVADDLTSQTYNYFIFKDSKGFVWISSINGLNRYDGQGIVQYLHDESDPHSLSSDNVQGWFYEDKNTDIWFATVNAINRYDRLNDRFDRYQINNNSTLQEDYKVLFFDKKNEELWLSVDIGDYTEEFYKLSISKPDSFTYVLDHYVTNNIVFVNGINTLSKKIYVPLQGEGGLSKLTVTPKNENDFSIEIDNLLKGIDLKDLYYENDQNVIWCVGPGGLYKISEDGEKYEIGTNDGETRLKTMNSIVPFGENQLLIGTVSEGLFLVDKEATHIKHQVYVAKDGKVQRFNSPVDLISVDNEGTIWISTNGQGIFYLTPGYQKMKAYLQDYNGEFLGRSNIQAMAEDQDGLIWCLNKGEGVVVVDSLGNTVPEFRYLIKGAHYIFSDDQNQIFVCSSQGLYMLSRTTKTFKQVPSVDGSIPEGFIQGLQCRNNKVLVSALLNWSEDLPANLFELVDTKNGPQLKPISCDDTLTGITKMFEDSNGGIYLCRDGLEILIGTIEEGEYLTDTIFNEQFVVRGLAEDTLNHCVWMATQRGLVQIKKETTGYTLIKNKTFDLTNLNGILFDDITGYLWISNNNGLHAFHPDSSEYRSFTLAEGLQSQEFNFWSALKTSTGLFAFGGTNGINIFNPQEALRLSAKIPVPKITNILIDDTPDTSLVCANTGARNVSEIESLVLKYSKNTVSFNFAALDYCDPSANKFQFRMDKIDADWVYSGNTNSARYPNLPIGDYEFMVRASSAEGVWPKESQSEFITKLKIEILAPWYRTWLACFIYALLIIGLAYAFYRSRINRIKKEAEFKRKEAEFKQKEAEYKQLAAETETAVLRLQMNPHFIFNSMNSISSYILERDVDTANAYLDRFAKLMRMILQLGKQPIIPVADEIELLQLYMETEAMRFEQKFEYHFDLGPDIDEDDTFFPTMLLQPFVENSIWHGLAGKSGKGLIKIRFWKDDVSLFCAIEDNGIGIEASKKKKKLTAHKSQALEITRSRLELLGEKEGKKTGFSFEDILDEAGQIAGTRVLVQIPLL